MCRAPLLRASALYCPQGHSQQEDIPDSIVGNQDRHKDDDDELQFLGSTAAVPLRKQIPVQQAVAHRSKAVGKDARQKTTNQQRGLYGINPSNDNFVKKPLVVWLVERPPIKPVSLGIALSGRFEISLQDFASSSTVDRFVRKVLENCPPFNEHKDISTGSLVIDTSRLAYIGKIENGACAWWASWEVLVVADDLTSFLGGEKALNLCIPVERTQQSPEPEVKPKRGRPRI